MGPRKTVLFIVEGPSDEAALEKIFKRIYRKNKNIIFKFTNGDISSDFEVTKDNVEGKIYDKVLEVMRDTKITKSDLFQIVQVFDTDGTYISDDAIIKGDTKEFLYSEKNICCVDVQKVIERNTHKRDVMEYLLSIKNIRSIPYTMYFMSCNLDHALYNKINLDKDDKQRYADQFYEKFIGKEYMFIEFLKTDVVNGVPNSLPESWKYIKQGVHSLERHTNLHIYFDENLRPDGLL